MTLCHETSDNRRFECTLRHEASDNRRFVCTLRFHLQGCWDPRRVNSLNCLDSDAVQLWEYFPTFRRTVKSYPEDEGTKIIRSMVTAFPYLKFTWQQSFSKLSIMTDGGWRKQVCFALVAYLMIMSAAELLQWLRRDDSWKMNWKWSQESVRWQQCKLIQSAWPPIAEKFPQSAEPLVNVAMLNSLLLTSGSTLLLEKLIVPQLVKKNLRFIETQYSLPR